MAAIVARPSKPGQSRRRSAAPHRRSPVALEAIPSRGFVRPPTTDDAPVETLRLLLEPLVLRHASRSLSRPRSRSGDCRRPQRLPLPTPRVPPARTTNTRVDGNFRARCSHASWRYGSPWIAQRFSARADLPPRSWSRSVRTRALATWPFWARAHRHGTEVVVFVVWRRVRMGRYRAASSTGFLFAIPAGKVLTHGTQSAAAASRAPRR